MEEIEKLKKEKDKAYWERNQLVSALSKIFPAHLSKHPEEDKEWDDDWRTIVFMEIPTHYRVREDEKLEKDFPHQISWHIHDTDIPMFDHLKYKDNLWDGHDTEMKYQRLRTIISMSER